MKIFITRAIIFLIVGFICAELISRLFIDPFYFYLIDTYNVKMNEFSLKKVYGFKKTEHVDYLFIGTSRVPANINPQAIMREMPNKIAVVAGAGYTTAGIHYQALKNRLLKYPDYLKGTKVFIEYPGVGIYTEPFHENKLRVYEPIFPTEKAMPHLLLPHLNLNSLITFLKESKNPTSVKLDLVLRYIISTYRTKFLIEEKVKIRFNKSLVVNKNKQHLVSDGRIRNDNFEFAKQKALDVAAIESKKIEDSPLISVNDLNKSSLAYIYNLIKENGGTLYLYKMPLSSIQEAVYNSNKAQQNKRVFDSWLLSKGLKVLDNDKFHFQDSDFPDTWHLSGDRRDEFTLLLFDEIKKQEHTTQRRSGFKNSDYQPFLYNYASN